jgi:hypothetical protein
MFVQAFIAQSSIERFHVRILARLAGLDATQSDAPQNVLD